MDCPQSRPRRQAVLIAVHPDGFLEAFAERNLDVAFARLPVASNQASERLAEACFAMLLPKRYADLWQRDHLRSVGTAEPLTPEAVLATLETKDCIAALNKAMEAA
jgi:hypothetical protein